MSVAVVLTRQIRCFVEVDAVEEDGDLRRSDERALKVNAHRGRVIGILPEVACVFASEEIHITGCEGEHIHRGAVESGISPAGSLAVGRTVCHGLGGTVDEWAREVQCALGNVECAEDGHDRL